MPPALALTGEIFADESYWYREDDRLWHYPPPAELEGDMVLALICALQAASFEVTGEYQHRGAAVQELKAALEAATVGDYVGSGVTRTVDEMQLVLAEATRNVSSRLTDASVEGLE